MVRLYSSIQRQTQRGQLFAQASFSQLGQDLRVRLPLLDGLEHTSPTDSDHIPGYRSQFHGSCFQHLVDAIDLPSVRSSTSFFSWARFIMLSPNGTRTISGNNVRMSIRIKNAAAPQRSTSNAQRLTSNAEFKVEQASSLLVFWFASWKLALR